MEFVVTLDQAHHDAVQKRARDLGKTPQEYIHGLIDNAGATFDEILAPVRKSFESLSDDDLDAIFNRAQKAARNSP